MISKRSIPLHPLACLLVLFVVSVHAGTNDPVQQPARYLLVIDTSSPMRSRAPALEASVSGLLESRMQGEIADGDHLGIWTYNNELHTGDFELVVWEDAAREVIHESVMNFLGQQRYRKATDFANVMPELLGVVSDSRRITVLIYCDGDEIFSGTPFDDAVGAYFQENAEAAKDQRIPFLTVLRGHEGELIGHALGQPPWPVEFPEFPPEPEPVPVAEPASPETPVVLTQPDLSKTLVTTNTGPIVFSEPLIVSGSGRDANPPEGPSVITNTDLNPGREGPVSHRDETNTMPPDPRPVVPVSAEGSPASRSGGVSFAVLLGVGGGVLFLVALLAGVVLLRRARAPRHTSLITRSMDKKGGTK
jgi:hypothetical protein